MILFLYYNFICTALFTKQDCHKGEESRNKTMISGGSGTIEREAEQEKRWLCVNKEKPRQNNTMAA